MYIRVEDLIVGFFVETKCVRSPIPTCNSNCWTVKTGVLVGGIAVAGQAVQHSAIKSVGLLFIHKGCHGQRPFLHQKKDSCAVTLQWVAFCEAKRAHSSRSSDANGFSTRFPHTFPRFSISGLRCIARSSASNLHSSVPFILDKSMYVCMVLVCSTCTFWMRFSYSILFLYGTRFVCCIRFSLRFDRSPTNMAGCNKLTDELFCSCANC